MHHHNYVDSDYTFVVMDIYVHVPGVMQLLVDVCIFTCSESSICMYVYLAGVTVIYMYLYDV